MVVVVLAAAEGRYVLVLWIIPRLLVSNCSIVLFLVLIQCSSTQQPSHASNHRLITPKMIIFDPVRWTFLNSAIRSCSTNSRGRACMMPHHCSLIVISTKQLALDLWADNTSDRIGGIALLLFVLLRDFIRADESCCSSISNQRIHVIVVILMAGGGFSVV